MPNEDQVQADSKDETTLVADPLDAAKSTNSGTNELAAYEAEKNALLDNLNNDDEQGVELADLENEVENENAEADSIEEESEEQEEETFEEEETEPETQEAKTSKKIRFSNPDDLAVAAIAKAKKISLADAADIFRGQNTTKHEVEPDDKEETNASAETADTVTATIKELQQQKRDKFSALEFEAAAEIEEQIEALRDKRDELRASEAQKKILDEQKNAEKYYADYEKSEQKTLLYYRDAAVKDSPLAKEMARLESVMLELEDPLYYSPDKPFILAKKAASNLGIAMEKPGAAPVKKTVKHRPIQPAGGNARTTSTDANQAFEQEIAQLESLDAYERKFRRG